MPGVHVRTRTHPPAPSPAPPVEDRLVTRGQPRPPSTPDPTEPTRGQEASPLRQVTETALDPAYARAAARAPDQAAVRGPVSPRSAPHRLLLPLVLLLVGLLTAVSLQTAAQSAPARERLRGLLGTVYETRSEQRDDLAGGVREQRSVTADMLTRRRLADEAWAAATERIGSLAAPAGLAPARGPGVRVTLVDPPTGPASDAGNPRPLAQGPNSRLADHDLADMVNLLWSAGAEAVAVNGVRLTALSAVRAAGDAILVGLSPVEAPYVIEAIGVPGTIVARVASASVTVRLRTRVGAPPDAVTVARLDEVTVPAAPGPDLRYARGSGS
ncbi:DUF881 domain-containing protein [Parafrankia elaeagni]|uniref:DUF881 domain-containing protein n=1 Tax=Parafrankia elaeagni TaxID=222534 RepID=UPI00039B3339